MLSECETLSEFGVEEDSGEVATSVRPGTCDEMVLAEEIVGEAEGEICTDGAMGKNNDDEDDPVLLTAASNSSGDGAWKVLGTIGLSQALSPSG